MVNLVDCLTWKSWVQPLNVDEVDNELCDLGRELWERFQFVGDDGVDVPLEATAAGEIGLQQHVHSEASRPLSGTGFVAVTAALADALSRGRWRFR